MKLPDALPPLSGRIGGAIRAAFLTLLALTAAMLAIGGWMAAKDFFVTVPNNLQFGFMTGSGSVRHPDPNQVRIYTPTSEAARQSGLANDDIILSINGRAVPERATELQIGDMMGEVSGNTATLVTRSSDGAVRTHRLPRQADAWSATIARTGLTGFQRSAVLFGADQLRLLVLLTAALLLYRRRRRDPVALAFGATFLLYCHSSGSAFWFWHSLGIASAKDWMGLMVYPMLILGLNAFPDGKLASRWRRATVFAGVPLLLATVIVQYVWRPFPAATAPYLMLGLLLASVAGLVLRYRRLPRGGERQQIKWAVTGFAAFVLVMAFTFVPRLLGMNSLFDSGPAGFLASVLLSMLAGIVLPLGLLVSLLRYRLYDADAAISRSASYSFLTLLLVMVFAIAKNGLELVAEKSFDGTAAGAMSSGIAAALAALLITPLHHRIVKWSEEKFQKQLIRLRDGLPELVGDLRETATPRMLAEQVLEHVECGVRPTRAALVFGGEELARRGEAGPDAGYPVCLALRGEDRQELGAILLGPRPDGSLYGKAERQVLEGITGPVARALRIVVEREATAAAQETTLRRLNDELQALRTRLDRLDRPPLAAE